MGEGVERVRPRENVAEWAMLTEMLDYLRATVVHKVTGLTDEQARRRSVSPSALSPAGLVKHLTGVEWFWFTVDFAARHCGHLDLLREAIDGQTGE